MVVSDAKMTREERIRKFADEKVGLFTKAEIIQSCPDIAAAAIEKGLDEMKREGIIRTVGGGRGNTQNRLLRRSVRPAGLHQSPCSRTFFISAYTRSIHNSTSEKKRER